MLSIYVPTDMKIFGLCPERDPFTVIVCETCKLCLKPQALFHHFGNYTFIVLVDRKNFARVVTAVGLITGWPPRDRA